MDGLDQSSIRLLGFYHGNGTKATRDAANDKTLYKVSHAVSLGAVIKTLSVKFEKGTKRNPLSCLEDRPAVV